VPILDPTGSGPSSRELEARSTAAQQNAEAELALVRALREVTEARRAAISTTAAQIAADEREIERLRTLVASDATYTRALQNRQQQMVQNHQQLQRLQGAEEKYQQVADSAARKIGGLHEEQTKQLSNMANGYQKMAGTVETFMKSFDRLFTVTKAHVELKLSIQSTTDAMTGFSKASDLQIANLDKIRNNLNLTKLEWNDFAKTLRQGIDMGINQDQMNQLTKLLQARYGAQGGAAKAKEFLSAEQQSPGLMKAMREGDQARINEMTRSGGMSLEQRDLIKQIQALQTGRMGGTADANFSNEMARNSKILDDIKSGVLDFGQKWLQPMAAISLPAIVTGVGSTVIVLYQILGTLKMMQASGAMGGGGGRGLGGLLGGTDPTPTGPRKPGSPRSRGFGKSRGGKFGGLGTVAASIGSYMLMDAATSSMMGDDANPMLQEGINIGGSFAMEQGAERLATSFGSKVATKGGAAAAGKAVTGAGGSLGASAIAGPAAIIGLLGTGVDLVGSYYEDQFRAKADEARARGDFKRGTEESRKAGQAGGVAAIGGIAGMAATGAGVGALIGSVVPVVGTGIGAVVGGLLGAAIGLFQNSGRLMEGFKQTFLQKDSLLTKIPFFDSMRRDMENQEKINQILARSSGTLAAEYEATIPSVQAFRAAVAAAAQQAGMGLAQTRGRTAGTLSGQILAGGGTGDALQALAAQEIAGVQAQLKNFQDRVGTVGELTAKLEEGKALQEKIRANLDTLHAERAANEAGRKGLGFGHDEHRRSREREKAYDTAIGSERKNAATAADATKVAEENLANLKEQMAKYELAYSEAMSLTKMQGKQNQLMDLRLTAVKVESKVQQQLLAVFGNLTGTSQQATNAHFQRLSALNAENKIAKENMEALRKQYKENLARVDGDNTLDAGMKTRLRTRLNAEMSVAEAKERERSTQALVESINALKDTMNALVAGLRQSAAYRVGEARREGAQTSTEMGMFQGLSPGQTRQAFQGVANQSSAMAAAVAEAAPAARVAAEMAYESAIKAAQGLEGQAKADAVLEAQTQRSIAQTRITTEVEKSRLVALQDARKVLSEAGEAERRRIDTQKDVLESQRGLAEFVGASYQTQLAIQKQILNLKGQELASVRTQMKEMLDQGGESVRNTAEFQTLQRKEAQTAADLFKQSIGVQRDFMDKALGKMFGVPSGTKFQPGPGNQDFMAKQIFGEHMVGPGGIRIAGQVGPAAQRAALQQGALAGLNGLPVGRAAAPMGNGRFPVPGLSAPGVGGAPGTNPPPVQPAAQAQPVAQAMSSPSIMDISGNIKVEVSISQDGRFEAAIRRTVVQMAAEGVIVKGMRGLPGSV